MLEISDGVVHCQTCPGAFQLQVLVFNQHALTATSFCLEVYGSFCMNM
jgi:hypothetical protein